MATLSDIGAALRERRKRQGITLSALAEKSHVHRNTLSALERGVGNVELNTLLTVCEQLGVDIVLQPAAISGLLHGAALPPALADHSSAQPSALQKRIAARLATAGHPQKKSSQ